MCIGNFILSKFEHSKVVKMVKTKKTILLLASVIFSLQLFWACNNDDDEDTDGVTRGQVMVLNSDGDRVPRANVALTCESSLDRPCDINFSGKTDEDGIYEREFDLPKVLKVNAYKVVMDTTIEGTVPDTTRTISKDSLCGETYISIIEGETNRQTVTLFSCE